MSMNIRLQHEIKRFNLH